MQVMSDVVIFSKLTGAVGAGNSDLLLKYDMSEKACRQWDG